MEEVIESAMVTLDAMTAAVEAVEAMVTAVDMLDCLAPGKPESDREAAASFFQEALTVGKAWYGPPLGLYVVYESPWSGPSGLYWPGRLPGLIPFLTDCLLPHNSKTIQSAAMLAIKHLSRYREGRTFLHYIIFKSGTLDKLMGLACSTKYPEIRDQVVKTISKMAFLYEPEEPEPEECLARFQRFHPVLIRILQEPDNSAGVKKNAIECLDWWPWDNNQSPSERLFHSGAIQVLLEMLQAGKEAKAVITSAVKTLHWITTGNEPMKMLLEGGVLAACHQILKGLYEVRAKILSKFAGGMEEYREAIMSQEGLVDVVLDLALDLDITEDTLGFHKDTNLLLRNMVVLGSESLVRRLVSKELLLRLLAHHLNTPFDISSLYHYFIHNEALEAVQAMLGLAVTPDELRLWRRLFDNFGITDAIRRISLTDEETYLTEANPHPHILARTILDTYLNNPLPPPPPSKLPLIIYTKNAPY